MSQLEDAFRSKESRVTKTIVAIDLTDSTSMKEREPETNWLTTYSWFFEQLATTIGQHGRIVKYLGDGAMAVFTEDNAAEAINWAIRVQEALAEARGERRVSCDCSVGIAYGEVVEFDLPGMPEYKDYIGTVVDRAFRLCAAANANAIFVDLDTITAAAMNRVTSRVGATYPKRKAAEYQGPMESVRAKGFSKPIEYHEILWHTSRFSVRPATATDLSRKESVPEHGTPIAPAPGVQPRPESAESPWRSGFVTNWDQNRDFGFVKSNEEEFYFNSSLLFRHTQPVQRGDEVWFIPTDAKQKNRLAKDLISIGAMLDGRIDRVNPKGFCFVVSQADSGEQYRFFIFLGESSGWDPGMDIEFEVERSRRNDIAGRNARVKGQGLREA